MRTASGAAGSAALYSRPVNSTQRHIRSFVLRQGRVSNAQRRAVDSLLPLFGIAYLPAPCDFDAAFTRSAPRFLEIGFGMGETTAQIAAEHPHNDYIGVEVHTPGVGGLLRLIEAQQLTNIRIIQHDAVEVVTNMIPVGVLSGIHVFFPDPWPKKRHHKRRLLQPAFAHLLASRLQPGGLLHVATDWEEYASHILQILAEEALLVNSVEGFAPRPDYRPLTKFESRGLKLGHGVRDIIFRRRDAASAAHASVPASSAQ
ncbi:MAG: tRNA (guanosine(46)-N7)-methyltransferase TrmB [Prolixibacteraceae bacterium]|nr:tRNA (guanosine(46)-N7)-methyltransferase TrmB [Burkholderiales bacterium]